MSTVSVQTAVSLAGCFGLVVFESSQGMARRKSNCAQPQSQGASSNAPSTIGRTTTNRGPRAASLDIRGIPSCELAFIGDQRLGAR
ncbi:MAG: hypothetical protein K1X74_01925 [Pirellulales bacterium]|nr:hypothetical protein [Pirellulales bacterium]